jgi:pilus assembly protein CpaB
MDDAALRDGLARLGAALGGRRRLTAAVLAGVAVVTGVRAVHPAQPPTRLVWAAARDLSGGTPLAAADLQRVALPAAVVPAGALAVGTRVVGRLLAAPVRRGEPLTDVRLLEPSLLAALPQPGLVAVPVRVADGSAAAALVHAGDLVDVLAAAAPADAVGAPVPTTVATGARVLAVPVRVDATSGDGGGLVVLAVTARQASALARASAGSRLSLALERP